MERVERLINLIIALLDTRRPMTAEDIRERVAGYDQTTHEAFRRAFERDKNSLRALGIPLEIVPTDPFSDTADGYIIPKERYYLPPLDLEPDEAAALRVAAESVLGASGRSGLLKLSLDEAAGSWDAPRLGWEAGIGGDGSALEELYAAVTERRPVRFRYRRSGARTETRTLDPYGLVNSRGHWYVVGRDHERDGIRAFRVDRLTGPPEALPGSFEPPPDFDARAHVAVEPWEIGDRHVRATVRFAPRWRWWVEQNLADQATAEAPDGAIDVALEVADVERFVTWLLPFGDGFEVLEPPEVRDALLQRLAPYLEAAP